MNCSKFHSQTAHYQDHQEPHSLGKYHAVSVPHHPIDFTSAVQPQANECLQYILSRSLVSDIFAASDICALLAQMCDNVHDLRFKLYSKQIKWLNIFHDI